MKKNILYSMKKLLNKYKLELWSEMALTLLK